jgi:hypothetical protein
MGIKMGKKKFKFTRWSDGHINPERTINVTSDIQLTAIYEKEGILSLFKGKIGEYKVIGELLKRALDVYIPIVDVRGIDCIVRVQVGRFVEVQVKTRGTQKRGKEIFDVKSFEPRDGYFIICYREDLDAVWVLPSSVFKKHSSTRKDGKLRLTLTAKKQEQLEQYKNNWDLIARG